MSALRGLPRIAPPTSSCSRSFAHCLRKIRVAGTHEDDAPTAIRTREDPVVGEAAELDRERARDREEEVEVDGDVEDREGDLLDRDARRASP